MNIITQKQVLDILEPVNDPELNQSLVKLGMIQDISINEKNDINFRLVLTTMACPLKEFIKDDCINAVKSLPDVGEINIIFDAKPLTKSSLNQPNIDTKYFKDIKYVILVASGKGGVGKTTVAVNLALALQKMGGSVGILDTDIYGPNIPNMLGETSSEIGLFEENGKEIMIPINIANMKVLSMSFFIDKEQPVLWRGPMLNSIIQQFLFQTQWGELDYLIIDTPPGTGDVQLSLSSLAPIDGAIIVTTAQNASLTDVKRSISQCDKLNIPILGIVENMSYFVPEDAPEKSYDLFGSENGQKIKKELNIPVLSCLPFSIEARKAADEHIPIIAKNPDSIVAQEFYALAKTLSSQISIQRFQK